MTKKQKSNLAKTAIFMLEHKYELDMGDYRDGDSDLDRVPAPEEYNECGTTCCFAGHGPVAIGGVKKNDTWIDYVERVFTGDNDTFNFIFGSAWPNDKNQAAARALVILNGVVNMESVDLDSLYDSDNKFYPKYSKKRLIQELSKHV